MRELEPVVTASEAPKTTVMAASTARPCRTSPTNLPKVLVRATGTSSIMKISSQFVNGFGFSNG